jgi:hypothetical protein
VQFGLAVRLASGAGDLEAALGGCERGGRHARASLGLGEAGKQVGVHHEGAGPLHGRQGIIHLVHARRVALYGPRPPVEGGAGADVEVELALGCEGGGPRSHVRCPLGVVLQCGQPRVHQERVRGRQVVADFGRCCQAFARSWRGPSPRAIGDEARG